MPAGILLERCNVYGAETGGPRRVLGGLYGPQSATSPGLGLPDNVEQGEWICERPAAVRVRMVCRCSHKGQVMALCSWEDATAYHGEAGPGGAIRQVSHTVRQRGHYQEVQRRQSGLCPACAFPKGNGWDFAALMKSVQAWQAELTAYWPHHWRVARAVEIRAQLEDATRLFDEGRALGVIHNCPLKLEPVS
jgi:hypothetical protein